MRTSWDVLVVGSGIAGLWTALELGRDRRVLLVTKKRLSESNTNYAQGGIASVLAEDDRFEYHVADTLEAGAGLCHEHVVRRVVEAGPELIRALIQTGIHFTEAEGHLALGREGGHSHRRIAHAGDFTGREIEAGLVAQVRRSSNVDLLENHLAIDLLQDEEQRVVGAQVLDRRTRRVHEFLARVTILASGGSGKVYRYTSNPDIATGDGLAMAYRAGATVGNLEFFQFHPTCLYHPKAKNFLISEAVRGEGAVLLSAGGEPFMAGYHALADLAPRDIVARAIDREMKTRGEDYVQLDTTRIEAGQFERRFPNITATCREFGLDPTRRPLPVVPAAHYQCGGVVVDEHGASDLPGLYVIGEAACTGLHGANRLASNSLLEALYYARAAARHVHENVDAIGEPVLGLAPTEPGREAGPRATLRHDWEVARRTMWDYVGVVRDAARLRVALKRLSTMAADAEQWVQHYACNPDLYELRNVTRLGELVIRCALFRAESRGLHYVADHPAPDDAFLGDTYLRRDAQPVLHPLAFQARQRGV